MRPIAVSVATYATASRRMPSSQSGRSAWRKAKKSYWNSSSTTVFKRGSAPTSSINSRKAGASPLYLRTAFEIVRTWKSFHEAGAGRYVLADDIEGIVAQFIAELSNVHHHQSDLVTRTLGYLSAAKDGLSSKEFTDVLSRNAGVIGAILSDRHGDPQLPP
jgi:hypothetical protein